MFINNETILPEMPGLDQSLPQQRAMISVFHELHCLVRAFPSSARS